MFTVGVISWLESLSLSVSFPVLMYWKCLCFVVILSLYLSYSVCVSWAVCELLGGGRVGGVKWWLGSCTVCACVCARALSSIASHPHHLQYT